MGLGRHPVKEEPDICSAEDSGMMVAPGRSPVPPLRPTSADRLSSEERTGWVHWWLMAVPQTWVQSVASDGFQVQYLGGRVGSRATNPRDHLCSVL